MSLVPPSVVPSAAAAPWEDFSKKLEGIVLCPKYVKNNVIHSSQDEHNQFAKNHPSIRDVSYQPLGMSRSHGAKHTNYVAARDKGVFKLPQPRYTVSALLVEAVLGGNMVR